MAVLEASQVVGRDRELESFVRQLADNERLWAPLVRYTEPRLRLPLVTVPGMEARLLTWAPGQGTGFHDHGGSTGAFIVVRGRVVEDVVDDRGRKHTRMHGVHAVSSFGRDVIHDMRNEGTEGAVTIHAYRPELSGVRYYVFEQGELREIDTTAATNGERR